MKETKIGKMAAVAYNGKQYLANVVDQDADTGKVKRVRIQYDPELQGTVLMPSQYTFMEFVEQFDY